ncbi:3-deoxy-manno-octulosonate cytidylyltransferase [Vibrio parahaemolyticus]|uniref:3-deoxy-manno-octulosonate cytidylyltransferase n=2 Tax=Vibrio harveyi group TaxID=717610 RepID=UPI0010EC324F|nr:3-deoxy-manno-octulosonate cytidylyltransferase [Vibrio parahaemolyticus]ELA9322469.1 3-deoxy-manno-octulosonate cytidylyltransferase [Vibrio parahaemolyticus]ELB2241484.1 3-deoxy-manno-octulosonate cytidylyltransferase [Vibrio parahaemolyticus]MBM5098101.1 3-deoxy-manno-octulosonate cytidylyltransferase [Vibrio parahaemolyticus]MBM5101994.1 3-deoxy-manno-octulosonate cytidylyltransferase [Vibrio parahaemolyticus]MDF5471137.1 3-deoxy-manno-octulosonate cytidylyltransferase [Vibrio parahaemo
MTNEKNFAVVIPARYESSRFPGKPLVDICGKPMIQHVWERCCLAVGQEKVYVATDDSRIQNVVESFGGQVVMTSSECLTGTDRLAEANLQLNCDFIVNVQGDEPLINPQDINTVIEAFLKSGNVTNAMCVINSEQEFRSFTVPKVTFSQSGKLLYMSRAGIPQTKTGEYKFGYKQVCIYAFSKEQLAFFYSNKAKTRHEQVEDIEILRFLESDYVVDMVEVEAGSLAVDVPADVHSVINMLSSTKNTSVL